MKSSQLKLVDFTLDQKLLLIDAVIRSQFSYCSLIWMLRSSHQKFSFLCQNCFFNKVAGGSCNFIKKETLAQVFSCEFFEISKNTFFTEHVWATAFWCFANVLWIALWIIFTNLLHAFISIYNWNDKSENFTSKNLKYLGKKILKFLHGLSPTLKNDIYTARNYSLIWLIKIVSGNIHKVNQKMENWKMSMQDTW